MKKALLVLGLCSALAAQEKAEMRTVVLRNGNKFTGVVTEAGDMVKIAIPNMGTMDLPKSSIARIKPAGAALPLAASHKPALGEGASPEEISRRGIGEYVKGTDLTLSAKSINAWLYEGGLTQLQKSQVAGILKGKRIVWEGCLDSVKPSTEREAEKYGPYRAEIRSDGAPSAYRVYFTAESKDELLEARKGDLITFKGRIEEVGNMVRCIVDAKVVAVGEVASKGQRYNAAAEARRKQLKKMEKKKRQYRSPASSSGGGEWSDRRKFKKWSDRRDRQKK